MSDIDQVILRNSSFKICGTIEITVSSENKQPPS